MLGATVLLAVSAMLSATVLFLAGSTTAMEFRCTMDDDCSLNVIVNFVVVLFCFATQPYDDMQWHSYVAT